MMSDDCAVMPITPRPDATMVRGAGSYLWDADGRRYLDFVQGWAVNVLGHCPEAVTRALCEQARTLIHAGAAYHNDRQRALATALCSACTLDEVFFCNSGAEANEGAVKLARKWGQLHRDGAHRIITTRGSFHGRTLAMMAASGKPGFAQRFPPTVEGFTHVAFDDVEAVARHIDDDTVAVMVEPIQGEAGVVVPTDDYLVRLHDLTRAQGILLILDEVQTGVGRTGTLFCHQQAGVAPDIMTLGKGLGGGVTLAALLSTRQVSCFEPGDQGGTFNGNPLATAVGLSVLQAAMDPELLANVATRGLQLQRGLSCLPGVHTVRGRGLLVAARLHATRASEVRDACMAAGLLLNAPQPDILRFMPALNVAACEVDEALETLAEVLQR